MKNDDSNILNKDLDQESHNILEYYNLKDKIDKVIVKIKVRKGKKI